MKRTKEIGGKLLKYAGEKYQNGKQHTSDKIKKYVGNLNDVSHELIYSSRLMAGHKKITVNE